MCELRRGPITKSVFDRRLTAFQTANGQVAVLDAHCAHLGADLGHGRVVGDALECPYHHWQYGADGKCVRIPAQAEIPDFARQRSYPAVERHGYLFFFNGSAPLFPLPFFDGERPEDFAASKPLRFETDCPWFMLAANNSDRQHWDAVHNRQLLEPPCFDCPHPLARRTRFQAKVIGNSIFDRLLRRFAGDTVDVAIINWGGPFFVVSGAFRRSVSRMLVMAKPLEAGRRLQVDAIVLARRDRPRWIAPLVRPLSLWLRRLFTWGFMEEEFRQLVGVRYSPHTLIDSDREMLDFFRWAAALPRGPELGEKQADPIQGGQR